VIVTLAIAWVLTGLVIVIAGLLASRSGRALWVGLGATSFAMAGLGAVGTAALVGTGYDFGAVAAASYNETVRMGFAGAAAPLRSMVLALLIAFQASAGLVMWFRGRWVQVGLAAAIGFQIMLTALGWWYFLTSPVMIGGLILLWRAQRRQQVRPLYVADIMDARQPDHRR